MHPACLRPVQRPLDRDVRVGHQAQDVLVELVVVVAEHVEPEPHRLPRQEIVQDAMHVIPADKEQVVIPEPRGQRLLRRELAERQEPLIIRHTEGLPRSTAG